MRELTLHEIHHVAGGREFICDDPIACEICNPNGYQDKAQTTTTITQTTSYKVSIDVLIFSGEWGRENTVTVTEPSNQIGSPSLPLSPSEQLLWSPPIR